MTESTKKHPETKEQFQEAVADLTTKITNMCIVGEKACPTVTLISLFTATETVLEVIAYLEQVEQDRDKLEDTDQQDTDQQDTDQQELMKVIAKWVVLFTDAIIRGKQRFLEEKASEQGAGHRGDVR